MTMAADLSYTHTENALWTTGKAYICHQPRKRFAICTMTLKQRVTATQSTVVQSSLSLDRLSNHPGRGYFTPTEGSTSGVASFLLVGRPGVAETFAKGTLFPVQHLQCKPPNSRVGRAKGRSKMRRCETPFGTATGRPDDP